MQQGVPVGSWWSTGIEGVLEKREINKRDDLRMLKIQMENIKDYEKE